MQVRRSRMPVIERTTKQPVRLKYHSYSWRNVFFHFKVYALLSIWYVLIRLCVLINTTEMSPILLLNSRCVRTCPCMQAVRVATGLALAMGLLDLAPRTSAILSYATVYDRDSHSYMYTTLWRKSSHSIKQLSYRSTMYPSFLSKQLITKTNVLLTGPVTNGMSRHRHHDINLKHLWVYSRLLFVLTLTHSHTQIFPCEQQRAAYPDIGVADGRFIAQNNTQNRPNLSTC